jgi:peroxiredoxin Q/BCP
MVDEGKPAPDFELTSDTGEPVRLSSLRGKPVVLYFYPKDDTPGCTTQACGIRDAYAEFRDRGAVVLGVSPDDESSHVKFKEKYALPFTLLADPGHEVAEDYGVWVERNRYGKKSMGIERSTFVIDADGNLAAIKRRVKPDAHTAWALAEIEKLAAGTPH